MFCPHCGFHYPCTTKGRSRCVICAKWLSFTVQDFLGDSPIRIPEKICQSQLDLAESIEQAIQAKQSLVIQVGNGIERILALLLPAILARRRVLISTATSSLLQYLDKLAELKTKLGQLGVFFHYAHMKEPEQYLCLSAYYEKQDIYKTQNEAFDKWTKEFVQGNKTELIAKKIEIPRWWPQVSAENCIGTACPLARTAVEEYCPYVSASQEIPRAQIVVADHTTIGLNLKLAIPLPPEPEIWLIDEAHLAPSMLRKAYSYVLEQEVGDQLFSSLDEAILTELSPKGRELLCLIEKDHQILFKCLLENANVELCKTNSETIQFEIQRSQIEEILQRIKENLEAVLNDLFVVYMRVVPLGERASGLQTFSERLTKTIRHLAKYHQIISGVRNRSKNKISYVEIPKDLKTPPKLYCFPIFAGDALQLQAQSKNLTVISCSTILPFEWYTREMKYPSTATSLKVESPFQYGHQVCIYATTKIPLHHDYDAKEDELKSEGYFDALAYEIASLCQVSEGDAVVLFSSKSKVEEVKKRISKLMPFPLKVQFSLFRPLEKDIGIHESKPRLVIFSELPFPPQDDILLQAKRRNLKQHGCNDIFACVDFSEMCIGVLQTLDWLICASTDRGVLAILDRRFIEEYRSPGTYPNRLYSLFPASPDGTKIKVTSDIENIRKMLAAGAK